LQGRSDPKERVGGQEQGRSGARRQGVDGEGYFNRGSGPQLTHQRTLLGRKEKGTVLLVGAFVFPFPGFPSLEERKEGREGEFSSSLSKGINERGGKREKRGEGA